LTPLKAARRAFWQIAMDADPVNREAKKLFTVHRSLFIRHFEPSGSKWPMTTEH
jgi:hypothetical protein